MALLFIRFSPGLACNINKERHMYHGFLAPQSYLCSTSLTETALEASLLVKLTPKGGVGLTVLSQTEMKICSDLRIHDIFVSKTTGNATSCNFFAAIY